MKIQPKNEVFDSDDYRSTVDEKKRHHRRLYSDFIFKQMLENDGGVYSTEEVSSKLGVSVDMVERMRYTKKLLSLVIDGDFFYPAFQFIEEENISDMGVLLGLSDLLSELTKFSDRMQYSFFMEERNTVLNGMNQCGKPFTVVDVLMAMPNTELMNELHRLARNYGSHVSI